MEKFVINYSEQEQLKEALVLAKFYCEEHIEHADSWSKQGLESMLIELDNLSSSLGNSIVVGHFE